MDGSLVDSLAGEGWTSDQIHVLPLQRKDWLQVFWNGAFDVEFWKGDADPTRPAFRWYLQRIADQIEQMTAVTSSSGTTDDEDDDEEEEVQPQPSSSCSGVILVGHSAGGWLGRAAMGFGSDSSNGNSNEEADTEKDDSSDSSPSGPSVDLSKILGIVSLGAPHLPPPPDVMDMTRGALRITNEQFPGSFHMPEQQIFYLTVIGNTIQGEQQQRSSPFEPTTVKGFAYNSYEAVCGDGTTVGDGVVPVCSAHLDGAQQLDLDGVLHSINAPDNWYGSTGVIDRWHTPMLVQLKERIVQKQKQKQEQQKRSIVGVGGAVPLPAASGLFDALSNAVNSWSTKP